MGESESQLLYRLRAKTGLSFDGIRRHPTYQKMLSDARKEDSDEKIKIVEENKPVENKISFKDKIKKYFNGK